MTDKNWFDASAYADLFKPQEFSKLFEALKIPGVDAKALAEAHSKNLKAVVEANRIAAEGYQQVFKKQLEIVRSHFELLTELIRDGGVGVNPALNTEAVKAAFDKNLRQINELTEVLRKANEDAIAVVQERFQEGVEEIKTFGAGFANAAQAQTEKAVAAVKENVKKATGSSAA